MKQQALTKQKTTKTKEQKALQKYASNQAYILQVVNLNKFEYYNFVFELGCKFLEDIYPPNTQYHKFYTKISRDKMFWSWWRVEFYNWQAELIDLIQHHNIKLTHKIFIEEMEVLHADGRTEANYYNIYLKKLSKHNV